MWLETITVRTATVGDLEDQVPHLLRQLAAAASATQINAYTRYPTNRDLSFHLIHERSPAEPTVEGIRLADSLRAYGSVAHSIWLSIPVT